MRKVSSNSDKEKEIIAEIPKMKLEVDDQMILLHFDWDDQSLSNLMYEEKKIKDEFIDKLDPSIDKFTF